MKAILKLFKALFFWLVSVYQKQFKTFKIRVKLLIKVVTIILYIDAIVVIRDKYP